MTEARITCMCQTLIIADLGLSMSKGDIVFVSEMRARKSADLTRASRVSAVVVQYVKRARELKPARKPRPAVVQQPTAVQQHRKEELLTVPQVPAPVQPDVTKIVKEQIAPLAQKIDSLIENLQQPADLRKRKK